MVRVSAPAKVILTGEHAVVHGETCVAAATDIRLYADVIATCGGEFVVRVHKPARDQLPVLFAENGTETAQGRAILSATIKGDVIEMRWHVSDLLPAFLQLRSEISTSLLNSAQQNKQSQHVVAELARPILTPVCISRPPLAQPMLWTAESCLLLLYLALSRAYTQPSSDIPVSGLEWGVDIRTDVPMGRGMGSSAAMCVAVGAALGIAIARSAPSSTTELQQVDASRISVDAGIAEHLIHGNPSGVDTAVSCFGGLVAFRPRNPPGQQIESVPIAHGFTALVVDTGVERETRKLVANVGECLAEAPDIYQPALTIMGDTSEQLVSRLHLVSSHADPSHALDTLVSSFLIPRMGNLHTLLTVCGVGHPQLDRVRDVAAGFGCGGCKLTGAGGGGCALVVPGPKYEGLELLEAGLTQQGFTVYRTCLGAEGVREEH